MSKCKCGSYAINHRSHGRVAEKHSDLCDVCYWRAEVAQARADALRWVLVQMKPFPNRFGEWPTVAAEIREKGINEYLATLRSIIEKELNQ